jgi:cytochrome c peroxidase
MYLNNGYETSMIRLTQTRMKIHHASSIRPIKKNYLRMKKSLLVISILMMWVYACKKDVAMIPTDNDNNNEDYSYDPTPYIINLPNRGGWSMFPIPNDNILTKAKVALGKKLFFDPILSVDNTVSCASCHDPKRAFTDGKRFSTGVNGAVLSRNTMPLFNLPWADRFAESVHRYFWDGGANDLERQALAPIVNPLEMGNTLPNALNALQKHPEYPKLFKRAFGSDSITSANLAKALASFERTLISTNSKFDRYIRGEVQLTPEEFNGMFIFSLENKGDCFHCHGNTVSPYFTDFSFRNNGLQSNFSDSGLMRITGNPADLGKFKVPSLRNLSFTAPYMHDGRFATLEAVIDFYSGGIKNSSTVDPNIAKHLRDGGVNLNPLEKRDLLLFLLTLNDSTFVNNPEFIQP